MHEHDALSETEEHVDVEVTNCPECGTTWETVVTERPSHDRKERPRAT